MRTYITAVFLCVTIMCSCLGPAWAAGSLAAPTNLVAEQPEVGNVVLHWTDNCSLESGYAIERKSGANDSYFQIGSVGANVTSFDQNELSTYPIFPGEKYYYRVKAFKGTAASDYSNEVYVEVGSHTSTPKSPEALRVKAVNEIKYPTVNLFWEDRADNETKYLVQRKKKDGGSFVTVKELPANSFSYHDQDKLDRDVYYTYRVQAINDGGAGTSNTADVILWSTRPQGPGNFWSQSLGTSKIKLTWTDMSNNEDGFVVQRVIPGTENSWTGVQFEVVHRSWPNETSWTDTGVKPNSMYAYKLHSFNIAGESQYGCYASSGTGPPAPKITRVAKIRKTKLKITWTSQYAGASYFIERKMAGGSYIKIAEVGSSNRSYIDSGLRPGITYKYRIKTSMQNQWGKYYSDYSNESGMTMPR
ncbi:MAG: fibronectin type III domain-containing protein [Acidobacteriota bacterium]